MEEKTDDVIPEKRHKDCSDMGKADKTLFLNVALYFAPERIQKNRLSIMKNCAVKNNFTVIDKFSDEVTYIVTEFDEEAQVIKSLKMNMDEWNLRKRPKIVNTKWFAECVKQRKIIEVQPCHCLKTLKTKNENNESTDYQSVPRYACQRMNPLHHHNHRLTDALEILAESAELETDSTNMGRALAFRKAASVLKSLPTEITRIEQVKNTKDIGRHSLNVIREILDNGKCTEVDELSKSEQFCTVKLFNSIYGIGPAMANKWFASGLRTIEDIKKILSSKSTNKRLNYGLAFHEDLAKPILKSKALEILKIVENETKVIEKNASVCLIGGFRRGKTKGHDVDILISHTTEGKEIGLLSNILKRLKERNLVLYGGIERFNTQDPMQFLSKTSIDNFEKCFLIFKDFDKECHDTVLENADGSDLEFLLKMASRPRSWTARRVDLVIAPRSQFYFALVGWTGNKHFERSLKNYAKKEKNMKLTSHGLYDFTEDRLLPASSEEEVFRHLELPYYEPYYRNA
ncbi:DNA-directed DNA/RNA polymerase mu-like [Centruroides vittatus]|uniref:DNA-directed DNA/RNA polymerase mu-like n=1 Tax=Centruroides vittatus TaxID=120091 RepID=UPI0035104754